MPRFSPAPPPKKRCSRSFIPHTWSIVIPSTSALTPAAISWLGRAPSGLDGGASVVRRYTIRSAARDAASGVGKEREH